MIRNTIPYVVAVVSSLLAGVLLLGGPLTEYFRQTTMNAPTTKPPARL